MASKHKSPFKGINAKFKKPRTIRKAKAMKTGYGYKGKDKHKFASR